MQLQMKKKILLYIFKLSTAKCDMKNKLKKLTNNRSGNVLCFDLRQCLHNILNFIQKKSLHTNNTFVCALFVMIMNALNEFWQQQKLESLNSDTILDKYMNKAEVMRYIFCFTSYTFSCQL